MGSEYSKLEIARSNEERELSRAIYTEGIIPRAEYGSRQQAIRWQYARRTRVLALADEVERLLATG